MDRIEELTQQIVEQGRKIEKLKNYIANLEGDGDRLNRALTVANSYIDCFDRLDLPIPILVVGTNLQIQYVNSAFCTFSEVSKDKLKDHPLMEIPLKCEDFQSLLIELFEKKVPIIDKKINFVSPSEMPYKLTVDAIPMLDLASGAVLGGFLIFTEVIDHSMRKYLMFNLSKQEYALNIKAIQHITSSSAITKLPATPAWLLGVINLWGTTIPILDIKKMLAVEGETSSERESVVIIEKWIGAQRRNFGLLVDQVNGVITIPSKYVEPWHNIGIDAKIDYIEGIAKMDSSATVIIDAERILNWIEERGSLQVLETSTT
ncbi:MAG: chemotaxis protein CheW [Syntrophobacteraceae bacterium]